MLSFTLDIQIDLEMNTFVLIIFARLSPICLLNLINMFHHIRYIKQDSIVHSQIHVTLI